MLPSAYLQKQHECLDKHSHKPNSGECKGSRGRRRPEHGGQEEDEDKESDAIWSKPAQSCDNMKWNEK